MSLLMLFQRKIFTYAEKERGDESSSFLPPAPGGGVELDAAGGVGCLALILVALGQRKMRDALGTFWFQPPPPDCVEVMGLTDPLSSPYIYKILSVKSWLLWHDLRWLELRLYPFPSELGDSCFGTSP